MRTKRLYDDQDHRRCYIAVGSPSLPNQQWLIANMMQRCLGVIGDICIAEVSIQCNIGCFTNREVRERWKLRECMAYLQAMDSLPSFKVPMVQYRFIAL